MVMMIETTRGNMNKKCKQIQKNFNVVDDDDDVIKHNLSSIRKDKKRQIKRIKILKMLVQRE